MRLEGDVDTPSNPLPREGMFSEGNMENISTNPYQHLCKS